MRRPSAVALSVIVLAAGLLAAPDAPAAAAPPAPQTEWHGYHSDAAHSGRAANLPKVTPLRRAWSAPLDGAVYASPLVVGSVVIVATENNTLYGFVRSSGRLLWSWHFYPATPLSRLPCGNINPVGITGTPVYDPASKRVFAVVTTPTRTSIRHILVGVQASTGRLLSRRAVDPSGQDPRVENQRGALNLVRGNVLVTYGGHAGDCGSYHGYLLEVPIKGGATRTYKTGTGREAGMWQPSGPTVGPDTWVYVVTGNGSRTSGAWDGGNAVHRVHPLTAARSSFFAPSDWASGNATDRDLGSSGATLVGNRIWIQGKTSTGYLLDAGSLGGVGHPLATVHNACAKQFGGSAVDGSFAFLPCTDGVRKITISGSSVTLGWKAPSNITGSPVVGAGAVWTLDPSGGRLYALSEGTGRVVSSLAIGTTTRFATPALSGDLVLVGTVRGIFAVRGA